MYGKVYLKSYVFGKRMKNFFVFHKMWVWPTKRGSAEERKFEKTKTWWERKYFKNCEKFYLFVLALIYSLIRDRLQNLLLILSEFEQIDRTSIPPEVKFA